MLRVYLRHHAKVHRPLHRIAVHGIAVDDAVRVRQLARLLRECLQVERALERLAGKPLHAKVALSPLKLAKFLYDDLGLRPIRGKRDTAEVTIRRLTLKYPKQLGEIGPLILRHRRASALSKFFAEARVDADGRYRSSYSPTADSARMKSKKNPMGTGSNGQNTDREAREAFVPDPGCVFVQFDLSQIEDRVVKFLTGAERMRALARRPPWEADIHKETAAAIFRVAESEVTKEQRYLGKRTRHAKNYDMGEDVFSDTLLKDGVVRTPEECRMYLGALRDSEPEVPEWQRETRAKLMFERRLQASCGFTWHFDYHRLNRETYKSAYSLVPQHEAVCILNTHGLVPLDRWLEKHGAGRINVHAHDALLASVRPAMVPAYVAEAWRLLTRPWPVAGALMPVFVSCEIGKSWGKMPLTWEQQPTTAVVVEGLQRYGMA